LGGSADLKLIAQKVFAGLTIMETNETGESRSSKSGPDGGDWPADTHRVSRHCRRWPVGAPSGRFCWIDFARFVGLHIVNPAKTFLSD